MHVGELQAALQALAEARPDDAGLNNAVNSLLSRLDGHDDMALEDFVRLFKRRKPELSTNAPDISSVDRVTAHELRLVFNNDDAFEESLKRIERDKSVTKAVLAKVFYELFDRSAGIPKKATRSEILRLITDERHVLVRNEKMGKMLGRRIIAAE